MLVSCCGFSPVFQGLCNHICKENNLEVSFYKSVEDIISAKENSVLDKANFKEPDLLLFDIDSSDDTPDAKIVTSLRTSFPKAFVVPSVDSRFVDFTKQALLRGAAGFLEKPCTKDSILQIIQITLFSRN